MIEKEIYLAQNENQENTKGKPYVISEDIQILLKDWAKKQGFSLPSRDFFDSLRSEFSRFMKPIFSGFESVTENELTDGISRIVRKTGLYPVSLDRVYYHSEQSLDITRLVERDRQDRGLGRRLDSPLLIEQFRQLRKSNIKEIILIDDVIFTGGLIKRVCRLFEKMGIRVLAVGAAIGILEGIEQLNGSGQEVYCVRKYEEVIDEICERDFYPGVSLCGRSLIGNKNVGVPYILPFGNPGVWASIPTNWQIPLSFFCLDQTIGLFKEIEKLSNRSVLCRDLERKVFLLPDDDSRFITALEVAKQQLNLPEGS